MMPCQTAGVHHGLIEEQLWLTIIQKIMGHVTGNIVPHETVDGACHFLQQVCISLHLHYRCVDNRIESSINEVCDKTR